MDHSRLGFLFCTALTLGACRSEEKRAAGTPIRAPTPIGATTDADSDGLPPTAEELAAAEKKKLEDEKEKTKDVASPSTALTGFYRSDCHSQGTPSYIIFRANFASTHVVFFVDYYSDSACASLSRSTTWEADYKISTPNFAIPGSTNYDLFNAVGIGAAKECYSIFKFTDPDSLVVGADDGQGNDCTTVAKRNRILSTAFTYKRIRATAPAPTGTP